MDLELSFLQDSVLRRTGCSFTALHKKVMEFECLGIEDFIENNSRIFEVDNSRVVVGFDVHTRQQVDNVNDGNSVSLDLSNSFIISCSLLVEKCHQCRNATSALLRGSTISSETWPLAVLDILCWFCPFLRQIDVTGCTGFSKSYLPNKHRSYQRRIEIIDYLDPSSIAKCPDSGEVIREMLAERAISPCISCEGWSLLHSAIFLGDTQLVTQLLQYILYENNNTIDDLLLQTALELATALHNLEIIMLLRNINVVYKDPSRLVQHCLLCIKTFDHPVIKAVVSNETALQGAKNVHDSQKCNVASVLLALCENGNVNFKRNVFEEILRKVHSCLKTDCCSLFSCGDEKAIGDFLQTLMKEVEGFSNLRIDNFPCLMYSLPSLYLIELLLNDGANIDDRDNLGCTALFHAVEKASVTLTPYCLSLIKFLLDKKANPQVRNNLGDSPLLYSLTRCSPPSCKLCPKMMTHVPVNLTTDKPVFVDRIVQVWSFLLNAGARGNIKDEMDRSLLHLLMKFLETGIIQPPICRALICTGLTLLQHGGLEVNARDAEGNTPLHCWANLSNEISSDDLMQIGNELVLNGGAVNARNDKGKTPLHFSQSWEIADFLIDKGAEAGAPDLYGNTPFHTFIEKGLSITHQVEEDRWKKCLASGMNPFSANFDSKCLFDILLERQFFKSALNLLKVIYESDVNKQLRETARAYRNRSGDSLLHTACVVENTNASLICDYLLRNGWIANSQNTNDETPLLLACKSVKSLHSVLSNNILLLRRYHADKSIPDRQGGTCEAFLRRDLCDLLHQEVTRVSLSKQLKWIPQSVNHHCALAEVVLGLKTRKVDNFYHHEKCIGAGSFGSVFPGLNEKDGREVAIKRLEKARLEQRGTVLEREIKCLQELSDCSFVLNYISCASDENFQYLVVELMEGSLDDYLPNNEVCEEAFTICLNIGNGLEFLHNRNVLHRDLKPQNILYKTQPAFVVKISDFGISKILHGVQSGALSETVLNSRVGTRCWMAPELLTKKSKDHSEASDIFSCGLIFHYVLAMKKHPFGSYSDESSAEINPQETERNITRNQQRFCESLAPEANNLLTHMLLPKPKRRPSASSLQNFPFFWDNRKKVEFLTIVGNQKEFEEPRVNLFRSLSLVEETLENLYLECLEGASEDWETAIQDVYDEVTGMYKYRNYKTISAVELVRFIRNSYIHSHDLSPEVKDLLWEDFVFLKRFPFLVTVVYRAVKACSSWRARNQLKNFF